MRITITLFLLICSSCGFLKKNSRSEAAVLRYDSSYQASEHQVMSLDQIRTNTKIYGDTLKGGFVFPLDSIASPVWLESTGVAVGVNAKMEAGKLRVNVSAIAKPMAETQTSKQSSYSIREKEQTGTIQKGQTVAVSQTSFIKWGIPWYIYLIGAALLAVLIYKLFKRSLQ